MGVCKIFQRTGIVPLDCLFDCTQGCHDDDVHQFETLTAKTCNRCGATGLHWLPVVRADGRTDYMLHDERNRRHVCMPDPDDFGVEPPEESG